MGGRLHDESAYHRATSAFAEGPALRAVLVKEGLDQDSQDKSSLKMGALAFMHAWLAKLSCFLSLYLFELACLPAAALEFVEFVKKGHPGKDLESPKFRFSDTLRVCHIIGLIIRS